MWIKAAAARNWRVMNLLCLELNKKQNFIDSVINQTEFNAYEYQSQYLAIYYDNLNKDSLQQFNENIKLVGSM